MLCDINEKIIAAIALKGIHNAYVSERCTILTSPKIKTFHFHFHRYSNIIDEAIDITLRKRNQIPPENLTAQDIFYVQVTRIHELFKALTAIADSSVQQEQSSVKLSQTLLDISKIFLVSKSEFGSEI